MEIFEDIAKGKDSSRQDTKSRENKDKNTQDELQQTNLYM